MGEHGSVVLFGRGLATGNIGRLCPSPPTKISTNFLQHQEYVGMQVLNSWSKTSIHRFMKVPSISNHYLFSKFCEIYPPLTLHANIDHGLSLTQSSSLYSYSSNF